uniref:Uncharacterized protein n=1 Tax=Lactuca sativa TaxID=4236 RepID=A0A9R1XNV1_LACSA|nr:hypothetical protein LSAT_V11C200057570 [Lactuca sativa]
MRVRYIVVDRVQKVHLQTLCSELEIVKMNDNETINDFLGKISGIVAKFKILGSRLEEEMVKWWKLRLKSYEERLKSLDERDEEQGKLLLTNGDYDGRQYRQVRSWGRGFYKSERGRGRGSVEKFPHVDPLALKLLERLLAFDPKDHPSAEEILEYHPQMLQEYLHGGEQTSFLYPRERVPAPKEEGSSQEDLDKRPEYVASTLESPPQQAEGGENLRKLQCSKPIKECKYQCFQVYRIQRNTRGRIGFRATRCGVRDEIFCSEVARINTFVSRFIHGSQKKKKRRLIATLCNHVESKKASNKVITFGRKRLKSLDERDEEQGQLLLTNGDYDGRQYKRVRSWGRGFYRSERGRGRGSIEVIRVGLSTMIVKSMDTLEISVQNGKTMKVKPI